MKNILSLAVITTLFLTIAPLGAEESNPAIVHRQAIYDIVGGHMKAIKSILMLEFDASKDLTFHAQGVVDGFSHMGNSFPPGSDKGKPRLSQRFGATKINLINSEKMPLQPPTSYSRRLRGR